ncbi:DsbA family oxidoreductase [Nitrogeniibacter aestuarii]|uniref:DsbA family oxidoreductase n=1 Tax=Nitrogeniibacter aestuarii TaxID=2815343 RepID=UPI001E4610FB|nr:DsbA family oxidoreductase [Nitrogeniibacter aestuarii]
MKLHIDLIADFVCPWCHVGEARLRSALALLAEKRPEVQVEIQRLPFFLDETTPPEGYEYQSYLERKFGSAEKVREVQQQVIEAGEPDGARFDFDKVELRPTTLPAHRLILQLQAVGADPVLVAKLAHGIFSAYFEGGRNIGDPKVLAMIAQLAGVQDKELAEWLEGDDAEDEVMEVYKQVKSLGIQGVPFFVFNQQFAVSGAQSAGNLLTAMEQALDAA